MERCAGIHRLLLVSLLTAVFGGLLPAHHHALHEAGSTHELAASHGHDAGPAHDVPSHHSGDHHADDCATCHLVRSLSTPLVVAPVDLSPVAARLREPLAPAIAVAAPFLPVYRGRAPPTAA
jgi:hypothetical protein